MSHSTYGPTPYLYAFSSDHRSILQRALELNATSFVDLVYALGMADEFTRGPLTLFLPSNEAFTGLSSKDKRRLRDQCFLRKLLKHHLVRGAKSTDVLKDGDTLITTGNEKLTISDFGDVSIILIPFVILFLA